MNNNAYEIFKVNSRNYKSQTLYAAGESYNVKKSKLYVPHPYDVSPEKIYENNMMKSYSTRVYHNEGLDKEKLFKLLNSSYVVNKYGENSNPSAGGLNPIELYVFIINVKNLKSGIYHYHREKGNLTYLRELNLDFLPPNNQFALNASFILLFTAFMNDLIAKYGVRGYRYALIECGHIAQNFYLNSKIQSIGCCPIGGFYDHIITDVLQLCENEEPLYIFCFGNKSPMEKDE